MECTIPRVVEGNCRCGGKTGAAVGAVTSSSRCCIRSCPSRPIGASVVALWGGVGNGMEVDAAHAGATEWAAAVPCAPLFLVLLFPPPLFLILCHSGRYKTTLRWDLCRYTWCGSAESPGTLLRTPGETAQAPPRSPPSGFVLDG